MKTVCLLLAVPFLVLAAFSIPVAIGCGLYDWAIADLELKVAAWQGFVVWITMIAMVIPGVILYAIGISK